MRRSAHSDQQILNFLKEAKNGASIDLVCRMAGVSKRTFYRWRSLYQGLEPKAVLRMRALEHENRRLKHVLEDLVRMLPAVPSPRRGGAPTRSDVGADGATRPTIIGRHPALRIRADVR